MKKTILLLLPCLFIFQTAWPQVFVNENNRWHNADCCYNFVTGEIDCDSRAYKFDAAIDIGGVVYFPLLDCKINDLNDCLPTGRFYREETGKVFLKFENINQEYLIYDFTISANDTFLLEQDFASYMLQVLELDTIELKSGETRKRWKVMNQFANEMYIIEGIGSMYAPMNPAFMFTLDCWTEFRCYFIADSLELGPGWCETIVGTRTEPNISLSFMVVPTPFSTSFRLLQLNTPIEISVDILDAQGRLLYARRNIREKESEFDMEQSGSGIYFLRIFSDTGLVHSMKVVKL